MYRKRLRPVWTDEELNQIYQQPHQHRQWVDHKYRVQATIGIGKVLQPSGNLVDLSCGDGAILRGITREQPGQYTMTFGDYAPHPAHQLTGPIEQTIRLAPFADLFVCSETIEHLDDPDTTLKDIRQKADKLLLSTPVGEADTDNPEHYWGWDEEAVQAMLVAAEWKPQVFARLQLPGYQYIYQIWGCD